MYKESTQDKSMVNLNPNTPTRSITNNRENAILSLLRTRFV
ncbi:hypothetical protein DDD_2064 [Nonlabens dokdonensis DSW-6]|uniref:Uncharacterized protein n=1 Tax=Nonlabens dokdonensis (strain DSM 17205 / KCTC 12402 / DSW-6) TaxID=592029 RepID=L7WAF2_NONDD|nr:hypothetical protein DDD_2064 [Nonlabens dokdonensis DSW-6]